ncbi:MAG: hypothetical protein M1833_004645 [Piccolia ochrophora]|nr:MAG: hypothetical protein M1833_004645 [Piccolia ochrophora]
MICLSQNIQDLHIGCLVSSHYLDFALRHMFSPKAIQTTTLEEPLGLFLGTFAASGLPANGVNALFVPNAVYGSRDQQGRINRRVSKQDRNNRAVTGGNYDPTRTSCSHQDIDYKPEFAGMDKEQVDAEKASYVS